MDFPVEYFKRLLRDIQKLIFTTGISTADFTTEI
jgi:hypothetical protein